MSDVKKPEKKPQDQSNVVQLGLTGCKSEACKKKPEKFGFCMEHYELYMAGVIRGDGKKPIDFEQKLSHYQQKVLKKVA